MESRLFARVDLINQSRLKQQSVAVNSAGVKINGSFHLKINGKYCVGPYDLPERLSWMNQRGGPAYGMYGMQSGGEPRGVRPLMSMPNPYMYPGDNSGQYGMPAPQFGNPYWRPPRGGHYNRPYDNYRPRGHHRGRAPYDNHFRPQKRPYYGHNRFESHGVWNPNANYRGGAQQSGSGKWQCTHQPRSAHCMAVMLDNPWEALERQSQGAGVRGDSEEDAASKLRDAKLEEGAAETAEMAETAETSDNASETHRDFEVKAESPGACESQPSAQTA